MKSVWKKCNVNVGCKRNRAHFVATVNLLTLLCHNIILYIIIWVVGNVFIFYIFKIMHSPAEFLDYLI